MDVKVGTVMNMSPAEMAEALSGHHFRVRMVPTGQRVEVRVTGNVTAENGLEVVVVAKTPGP